MKTVLIAYGTRFGSTEEVAQRIKEILEEHDCSVQLLDVKGVKEKKWPSLHNYNGVIVGSSIKMMKWMKEPKRFLQKYQQELSSGDKILGVFVSSMGAAIPDQQQETHDKCISDVMHELRIQPAISDAFGGVFDFSSSSRMGYIDKRMARFAAMAMTEESGLNIDTDARNDFRDWDQIRDFTERFRKLLNSET
ncbi:MAG: flavodoxin domain-containing protein [Promethearchaeota archaeon]